MLAQAELPAESVHSATPALSDSPFHIQKAPHLRVVRSPGEALARPPGIFPIAVNYGCGMEKMIATGEYKWAHAHVAEIPTSGSGVKIVDIHLVHLDRLTAPGKVDEEVKKRGLRHADLPELLALGATWKHLQRRFPIAAFGSSWHCPAGKRHVPMLRTFAGERGIYLRPLSLRWDTVCRFAAVPR